MSLSNKCAKIISSVLLFIIFAQACYGNQEQVIKEEISLTNEYKDIFELEFFSVKKNTTKIAFPTLLLEMPQEEITIKETILTEEQKSEKVETEIPIDNKSLYVYYEVYDFFYGSETYHTLDYELQEYTYDLCVENQIEEYYTLILCQLYYESQYKADAISKSNDYGIAQINKCNHEWLSGKLGITDFLDAKQSIACNIYMMSNCLKKYSVESSLFCYNTGKVNGSNAYSDNVIYMWNNGVRKIENSK